MQIQIDNRDCFLLIPNSFSVVHFLVYIGKTLPAVDLTHLLVVLTVHFQQPNLHKNEWPQKDLLVRCLWPRQLLFAWER